MNIILSLPFPDDSCIRLQLENLAEDFTRRLLAASKNCEILRAQQHMPGTPPPQQQADQEAQQKPFQSPQHSQSHEAIGFEGLRNMEDVSFDITKFQPIYNRYAAAYRQSQHDVVKKLQKAATVYMKKRIEYVEVLQGPGSDFKRLATLPR